MPRIQHKSNSTVLFGRFLMVAATLVMAGFLILGGMLMGAGGTGVFGERVPALRQAVGILTIVCGVALLPLGALMGRREAKRLVVAALAVVAVDLAGYLVAQHSVPTFGLVYAVALGIGFKLSR
jgi:hypothetical protein